MKKHRFSVCILAGFLVLVTGCATMGGRTLPEETDPVIQENLDSGWKALWKDDYTEARAAFNLVLESDPHLPEALRGKGLSLFCLGDYFAASELFLEAIEQDPASPYAVPMRDFVQTEIPHSLTVSNGLAVANRSLDRKNLPLWIRREARWGHLDYYADIVPNPPLARSASEKLGVITGWNILGPFQNISHSGFDNAFINETAVASEDRETTYVSGIATVPARWTTPRITSLSGEVLFSEYLGADYSTNYAETVFTVKDAGSYVFIFTQYGAMKAWLDEELILSDPEYRLGAEIHWIEKSLDAGEHRVLVKVSNLNSLAGFSVCMERIGTGELPEEIPEAYTALFPDTGLLGRDPLLESLASLMENDESGPEHYFWLSFMLAVKGYHYEGLSAAEEGRKFLFFGESALFDFLESRHYQGLGKEKEVFGSCVRSIRRNVLFAPSVAFLIEKYLDQERWNEADELIERTEESFGPWFYGTAYKAVKKATLEDEEGAKEEITAFQEAYPDSPWLDYELLLNPHIAANSSFQDLFGRIEKKGRPVDVQLRRLWRFMRREEYSAAFGIAKSLITWCPEREDVWAAYLESGLYSGGLKIEESKEIFDRCLESFPLSSDILHLDSVRSEVIIEHFSGDGSKTGSGDAEKKISEAEERLNESLSVYLSLHPDDFEVRDRLRELDDRKKLGSVIRVYDIFKIIDKFKLRSAPYNADAVTVLDEDMDIFFPDGGVMYQRQDVIKVLSRQGVRNESTFFLDFDPREENVDIDMAFIVKQNGAQVNALRSGRRLSFPGLEPGDYIVVSYSCTGVRRGTLMKELWDTVILNSPRPVFMKDYTMVYPSNMVPWTVYHNAEGIEVEEKTSNFDDQLQQLVVKVRNTEPVRWERWSPGWQDEYAWLDISTVSDWNDIASWYRDVYRGQCRVTPEIRKTVAELIEGAENREEIVARIYSFVSGTIDYEDLAFMYNAHVPQTADSVLEDRYGDCKDQSVLLITMLAAAGIDSHIALSLPGYRGEKAFLPSPRFSHAFVVTPEEGKDRILDPTTAVYTYPEIPAGLVGTWYLPVTMNETEDAVDLKRVEPDFDTNMTVLVFDLETGETEGRLKATGVYGGVYAGAVRNLRASKDDTLSDRLFGLMMASEIPGFRLEGIEARYLEDLEKSPVIDFDGTVPVSIVPAGGGTFSLALPWCVSLPPDLLNVDVIETASLDIAYPALATPRKQIIVLSLPPDYTLKELPENETFRWKAARAIFRYSECNGRLLCERELFVPVTTVAAEDVEDFRRFIAGVYRKEQGTILIEKSVKAAGSGGWMLP